MKKRIGKENVDVSSSKCGPHLDCYSLYYDKGTFAQGRGYTSYHKKPIAVCGTRFFRGCPEAGVCLDCRTIYSPAQKGERCGWCGSSNKQDSDLDETEGLAALPKNSPQPS